MSGICDVQGKPFLWSKIILVSYLAYGLDTAEVLKLTQNTYINQQASPFMIGLPYYISVLFPNIQASSLYQR